MEISYRIANIDDLDEISQLVENAIKHMEYEHIYQWDNIYPTKEDFSDDIKKNELYIGTINNKIAVVYVLNKKYDEQYKNGEWKYNSDNFNVIHRLCVSPDFQKKGIAHTTLLHIEGELRFLGIKSIRLDVFCENPYALKLYSNNGYHKVGVAHWRKGEFLLMEKLL
ncbi:MAG: GNAT family N-acetyltransferase [Oscillospiraceae bacterium]|nr:GNAT family N-acetyltransferase [Oscillospiraceae bacterium]